MRTTFFMFWLAVGVPTVLGAEKPVPTSWNIENDLVSLQLAYSSDGTFGPVSITHKESSRVWDHIQDGIRGPMQMNNWLHGQTQYGQPAYGTVKIAHGGLQHIFFLKPKYFDGTVEFNVEIYPGQPFVRTNFSYRNGSDRGILIRNADLLNWGFHEEGRDRAVNFAALHIDQWKHPNINFEINETPLTSGVVADIFSGAHGDHCSWIAVRDKLTDDGLVAGWEFNGQAQGEASHSPYRELLGLRVSMGVNYHLEPGAAISFPHSFIGLFKGDWDEAGYRTQRFVENVLAKPVPDKKKFPYLMFDSWGYGQDINEKTLRQAAKVAAGLGVEVFTVDLGWSRHIGDWHEDKNKFPGGLRALSDYVHSLGMKFGLHFALLEASSEAPVLKLHPDWRASVDNGYFGANSLCPAHQPVKEEIVREIIGAIKRYNVDWVLQDGENMVKVCSRAEHTHHPAGSNYANAQALDEIVAEIQRATPDTVWENCEDGGNMMTYKMVQNYVTSIGDDAAGTLAARKATYGVTFPFSPRYALKYMSEPVVSPYALRSHMFGGPLVLMQKITEWSDEQVQLAKKELELYKMLRVKIRDSKVIHLLDRPDGKKHDAIQAYNEKLDWSVVFVYRTEGKEDRQLIKPRGLRENTVYKIRSQDDPGVLSATGKKIMSDGLVVNLPGYYTAEIIYLEPQKSPGIADSDPGTGVYLGWVGTYKGNRLKKGAQLAKRSGFRTIRLPLMSSVEKDFAIGKKCYPGISLAELASLPHYRKVISDPAFSTVFLTIWGSGRSHEACKDRDSFFQYPLKKYLDPQFYNDQTKMDLLENEFRDLAYELLKHHRGTGKKFIIINWEGDNEIYCGASWFYTVDEKFRQQCGGMEYIHSRIEALSKYFVLRERGIKRGRDLACAEGLCGPKDARVLSAIEFNSIRTLQGKGYPSILDQVIPYVPQTDFYSYSAWESLNDKKLRQDLEELQVRFGKKLIVGEFGFDRGTVLDFEKRARETTEVLRELNVPGIRWQIFDQPPMGGDKGSYGLFDKDAKSSTRSF